MDIDVLSTLLHEVHIAERDYIAIGSANTYGKSILEAHELDQSFRRAQAAKRIAKRTLDNYLNDDSLVSARRAAIYAEAQSCISAT